MTNFQTCPRYYSCEHSDKVSCIFSLYFGYVYVPREGVVRIGTRKKEITHHMQFLLLPQRFLPFWTTFCHFIKFKIVVCKPFHFKSLKFVVWARVKSDLNKTQKKPEFLELRF